MSVSRRSFVASLGAGTAGLLTAPLIRWQGHEALLAQGQPERRADRLLASAPGMIRIDSNENPNGPGQHVFDAIMKHFSDANRYPNPNCNNANFGPDFEPQSRHLRCFCAHAGGFDKSLRGIVNFAAFPTARPVHVQRTASNSFLPLGWRSERPRN